MIPSPRHFGNTKFCDKEKPNFNQFYDIKSITIVFVCNKFFWP